MTKPTNRGLVHLVLAGELEQSSDGLVRLSEQVRKAPHREADRRPQQQHDEILQEIDLPKYFNSAPSATLGETFDERYLFHVDEAHEAFLVAVDISFPWAVATELMVDWIDMHRRFKEEVKESDAKKPRHFARIRMKLKRKELIRHHQIQVEHFVRAYDELACSNEVFKLGQEADKLRKQMEANIKEMVEKLDKEGYALQEKAKIMDATAQAFRKRTLKAKEEFQEQCIDGPTRLAFRAEMATYAGTGGTAAAVFAPAGIGSGIVAGFVAFAGLAFFRPAKVPASFWQSTFFPAPWRSKATCNSSN